MEITQAQLDTIADELATAKTNADNDEVDEAIKRINNVLEILSSIAGVPLGPVPNPEQ
jgi:hypothetical protein